MTYQSQPEPQPGSLTTRSSFWTWGWILGFAVGLLVVFMVQDILLIPSGQHGVLQQGHGFPWFFLGFLGVVGAHVWLVLLVAGLISTRRRLRATEWVAVIAVSLPTMLFHAFLWVDSRWWARVFGVMP